MNSESLYQKKLSKLRKKLDLLDSKILKILNQRFEIVHQVGVLKKEHAKEICDPKREKEIFARLLAEHATLEGKLTERDIHSIFNAILSCAKASEKDL